MHDGAFENDDSEMPLNLLNARPSEPQVDDDNSARIDLYPTIPTSTTVPTAYAIFPHKDSALEQTTIEGNASLLLPPLSWFLPTPRQTDHQPQPTVEHATPTTATGVSTTPSPSTALDHASATPNAAPSTRQPDHQPQPTVEHATPTTATGPSTGLDPALATLTAAPSARRPRLSMQHQQPLRALQPVSTLRWRH
jgi:hypothetical protein